MIKFNSIKKFISGSTKDFEKDETIYSKENYALNTDTNTLILLDGIHRVAEQPATQPKIGGGSGGTVDINDVYPVGTLYQTSDKNFDPNVTFSGTTWSKIDDITAANYIGPDIRYDVLDSNLNEIQDVVISEVYVWTRTA